MGLEPGLSGRALGSGTVVGGGGEGGLCGGGIV